LAGAAPVAAAVATGVACVAAAPAAGAFLTTSCLHSATRMKKNRSFFLVFSFLPVLWIRIRWFHD
jgi:tetrahydromethanopterin S-methyltransferase subunit D